MRKPRFLLSPALALAIFLLPATADAESIVPPSNSAAAQYTEAFPTAGGEKQVSGHKNGKRTPAKVLGGHDAHKLESKGKQGKEVANFAAETSPAPTAVAEPSDVAPPSDESGPGSNPPAAGKKSHAVAGGSGNGGGRGGNGKSANQGTSQSAAPASVGEPSGSSGFGEVIGQATGSSSSGELGLLLPLALVAATVWALVFYLRQRRRRIA
jgi:phage repressor protein C with HTH and peptisase S24 domain